MDDWNDLRLVLAVSRSGSLTSAARALGVVHSTAFRRLAAMEANLGVRLFERLPAGVYAPTDAGERIAAAAERIETETAALDRDLLGADLRLSGRLRVTCSETLAFSLLTPAIAAFRQAHPGIILDLVIDNRVLSLSRREADVALRVSRPREGDLYGRKVTDIGWTLYATESLLDTNGPFDIEAPSRHPFVGWEQQITGVNTADWIERNVPEGAVVYRTNSVINQMIAAREGVGVALLPCYLGDGESRLRRLAAEPLDELGRELWIVTHADLRRTARVRAFMESVTASLVRHRDLISGHRTADRNATAPRPAEPPSPA